jgi:hypothetical protein
MYDNNEHADVRLNDASIDIAHMVERAKELGVDDPRVMRLISRLEGVVGEMFELLMED